MKKVQPTHPAQQGGGQQSAGSNDFLLSLVIPCYNESKRIDLLLSGLADFEEKWKGAYEVIIVDDGSKDDTAAKIKEAIDSKYGFLKAKVAIEKMPQNGGKGSALKQGVAMANGDYILTLDADMSTKPAELLNWQKKDRNIFAQQDTIYIGSRRHAEGKIEALQSRKFIGGVFNSIVQLFTTLRLKDTQCGFKLYPRNAAKMLFGNMQSKGWAHDVELLYQGDLNDYHITEMPISWVNQPESKVNVVKDSIMMFFGVMVIAFRIWLYNTFLLPFRIPETATAEQRKHIVARSVFNLLCVLLVIIMPLMSFQYAITGDEHWHYDYGNDILKYFFRGDQAAPTGIPTGSPDGTQPSGIQFYGGLFDVITASFYRLFHFWSHYTTMHFINAIVGAVGIIYAGKLAKLLGGWNAAIIAIVLLVLSPSWFGHNFANPKDIPFSVGYTAGVYYIFLFLQGLPEPSFKHVFGLVCSIGWAMGVRIGGLLLIAYLVMFTGLYALLAGQIKAVFKGRVIRQMVVVSILGYVIAVIFWPYSHAGILSKPFEALKVMSNFFIRIGLLYEGKKITSDKIPWYYIPKYIWYTAPVIVLAGFAIGLLAIPSAYRKNKNTLLFSLFLLFVCVFPVFYAIYKKSALYDGWRHFLFVYPPLVIIASMGFAALMRAGKPMAWITAGLIAIGLISPVKYVAANHPFESLYYNEIAGGLPGIYGKYETDYYMLGIKPAAEWLIRNEHLDNGKPLTVATNCSYPLTEYMLPYKNVNVVYIRYGERYNKDWDYCIVFSRQLDPGLLTSGNWPPAETIHTISVQGVPITAVMKRRTHKDFAGFELIKAKNTEAGKAMLLEAVNEYPGDDPAWAMLANIYQAMGNTDSAVYAARRALKTSPADLGVYNTLCNIYLKSNRTDSVISICKELEKYNPSMSHYFTGYAYAVSGNINAAYAELDKAIDADPYNQEAYSLAMQIAKQTKDAARGEDYYEKAKKAFPSEE